MREFFCNKTGNFIGGWYMDDTTLCDEIIDWHKNSPYKLPGSITKNNDNDVVDLTIKNSIDANLNNNQVVYRKYAYFLQTCLEEYTKLYPWADKQAEYAAYEPINIQQYPPGGGYYSWHCERNNGVLPNSNRHLVFMTYLNDITDGGETEFYHQQLKIRPEKGLTLIWPADWTFTHRGIPSASQEKWIVTGWYTYVPRNVTENDMEAIRKNK